MSSSNLPKRFNLPSGRPALMGILNVTPDSFSDGGQHFSFEGALVAGIQMMELGADLIDVGGESTRPGSEAVSLEEELRRTIPVVEALGKQGIPVSIDTTKPGVAEAALDAGAFLINDVRGFRDEAMREVAIRRNATVCVMHMQGEPKTMQVSPTYGDVVTEVRDYLLRAVRSLAPLPNEQIWIDPGIGFGKTIKHNLELLRRLEAFTELPNPVLIGVSRKSFIGKILGSENEPLPTADRLEGTLAAQVAAQLKGVRIIRAHDVAATSRAIRMAAAIQGSA